MPRGLQPGTTRDGFGGKQPGAGRPRQRLTLSKVAATDLHALVLSRRQFAPDPTEEAIVEQLIRMARQEETDEYQRRADTGSRS